MAGDTRGPRHAKPVVLCVAQNMNMNRIFWLHPTKVFRYSLLLAIMVDGLIYTRVKIGGSNGSSSVNGLKGCLILWLFILPPRSGLILDNCRIHHVDRVEEMCNPRCVYHFSHYHGWHAFQRYQAHQPPTVLTRPQPNWRVLFLDQTLHSSQWTRIP